MTDKAEGQVFNKRVGRMVCHIRCMRGMSQEDLAKILGLSRASIANIETGRQALTLKLFVAFVQHFDVSASDFVALASTPVRMARQGMKRGMKKGSKVVPPQAVV